LEFFEEVYERNDDGKPVDVLYLDFARHLTSTSRKDCQKVANRWG